MNILTICLGVRGQALPLVLSLFSSVETEEKKKKESGELESGTAASDKLNVVRSTPFKVSHMTYTQ